MLGHQALGSSCLERTKSAPFGLFGGLAGATGRIRLEDGAGNMRDVRAKGAFELRDGATLHLDAPGSGGYGPPRERDPERIRQDLLDGYITAEAARRDYQVDPAKLLDGEGGRRLTRGRIRACYGPCISPKYIVS